MSAVGSPARKKIALPALSRNARDLYLSRLLLPLSIALWAYGVARTNTAYLGLLGLVAALPLVFYAALALVIISASVELARRGLSMVWLAAHSASLVVMLYGTAPLVYSEPRYSWLYKHVGIVQYINAHGSLSPKIDIFQNWPGFFAVAAWFEKVAGVSSSLVYAKWAQLLFELTIIPLLYLAYSALELPLRQRWIAILLYSASNWIAQDYFAPQALSSILSVGVMAIALRWTYTGNSFGRARQDDPAPHSDRQSRPSGRWHVPERWSRLPFLALLVVIYFVVTFSHELSPYIILIQLAALAAFNLIRPRWLPLVLAVIAFGYLLPRFGFINRNFGVVATIGNFFGNIAPPSAGELPVPPAESLIQHAAEALSLGIWLLALVGAWVRRRSRRTVLALLLLMISPVFVLVAGGYANEGILRVYLFSLPWAAGLAAAALSPLPTLASANRPHPSDVSSSRDHRLLLRHAWRVPIALASATALFLLAFFGNDAENVMPASEVNTITAFLRSEPPGLLFMADYDSPGWNIANYNKWYFTLIFGPRSVWPELQVNQGIAGRIARTALARNKGLAPAYVIVTPTMVAQNEANPITRSGNIAILLQSLARSGYWKLIIDKGGTIIYQLPPGESGVVPPGKTAEVNYSVP